MAGTKLQGFVIALAIAGCLFAGASALAASNSKVVTASGSALPRQSGWVRSSLMPPPPGRVTLRLSGCPGAPRYAGCVDMDHPRVIWMRRRVENARAVFLHELGHVFDALVLTDADRLAFKRISGRRVGWSEGKNEPAEWFADAYSLCARYAWIPDGVNASTHGYAPSPAGHLAACRLIRRAARRAAS